MTMRIRLAITLCTLVTSAFSMNALGAAGRTAGQFTLSPTGSAQYSIPLWVPPGIRGIQPTLALTYDSQSGYGLMGPGWTLSGLSAIARCNPTYAQDGGVPGPILLTTADGLCMDGNRLRTTGTGVYQTEIANFSQVTASGTAGNGPSYFTVQGKDGLTYEYGNTTDSKILPVGSSTPYIWALDKVTDRSGNYMTFTYNQSYGTYVPSSIQYTAPSGSTSFPYKITFAYTAKSSADILSAAVATTEVQQTEQLSTITVTYAGTTVREYKLLYTTSSATLRATLTSIQECGGSAGTDCLAATTVGYQYGVAGIVSPSTPTGSGPTAVPTGQYANGVGTADFNGDGIMDLFYTTTAGYVYVQLGSKSGYGAPINVGIICSTCTGTGPPFAVGDFLGAGRAQIILNYDGLLFLSQWDTASASFTLTQFHTPLTLTESYVVADVDGDGLDDLVSISDVGAAHPTLDVWRNTTTAGSTTPSFSLISYATLTTGSPPWKIYGKYSFPNSSVRSLDFNGDGRDDIVITSITTISTTTYYNAVPWVSTGSGYVPTYTASSPNAPITVMPVNWNDDNCTDLYAAHYIYVSGCGNGYPLSQQIGGGLIPDPWMALDWDGDGRTDLVIPIGSSFEVWKSTGTGDIPGITTGISVGGSPLSWIVTDGNGDGLDDLAFANPAASNALYYGIHNGSGAHPDLAISFTDGYGVASRPSYLSLEWAYTQGAYSIGSIAPFPEEPYVRPLYVVISTSASDGVGGTYSLNNVYDGGMTNVQGRGFGGFQDIKTTDSRTGITEYKSYYPIFPFSWMIGLHWFYNSTNHHSIWTLSNTLTENILNETPTAFRVFPFVSYSTLTTYEFGGVEDGQVITTADTNYGTPDTYGNFASVSTTVTDNDPSSPYVNDSWSTTTTNTISPDTSTWCLNLPTETTVTKSSTAPSGTAITRTVSYTPDYTNCRESQRVTEPSSTTYKVVEAYGYDSFGNLHTDTVTGIGMTPRVTTTTWNATGQFPQTIQNALGQSITLGFDSKTERWLG